MQLNYGQSKVKFAPFVENGLCSNDPRVGAAINRAEEYLIDAGKWKGLVRRMAFCHRSGCITLPRNVESVLEMSGPCGEPITLHNQWFEFLPGGPWQLSQCNRWCQTAVDRGDWFPTIYEITRTVASPAKYIRVYADLPEDAEAQILIQGIDENGNRVQTQVDGEWVDGEIIDLNNATPQLSTIQWSQIQAVQKPLTNGPVRIYQVDPDDHSINTGLIARYEPSEEIPQYRRIYFQGLCNNTCDDEDTTEHLRHITILAKMRYVPLVLDSDLLQITSTEAMRHILQSFYFSGAENPQLSEYHETKAIACLQAELKQYQSGGRATPRVKFAGFGNRSIAYQPR